MRKYVWSISVIVLIFMSCSKNQTHYLKIGVQPSRLEGVWEVESIVGLEAIEFAPGYKPFEDSIVLNDQKEYLLINGGDTTDSGKFTLGSSQAINGFGRVQAYDSISYHSTHYLTLNAPPPPKYYFKLDGDTLRMSLGYFKDSADYKFYVNYIKK